MRRALSAVINNAIKFSLNGGVVQVVVDHNPRSIWVSVRDQGIGIAEDQIPYIFDRFWRTEEHNGHLFGGVGLGLSIAKQVIEQHGGEINVSSPVNSALNLPSGWRFPLKKAPNGLSF